MNITYSGNYPKRANITNIAEKTGMVISILIPTVIVIFRLCNVVINAPYFYVVLFAVLIIGLFLFYFCFSERLNYETYLFIKNGEICGYNLSTEATRKISLLVKNKAKVKEFHFGISKIYYSTERDANGIEFDIYNNILKLRKNS